MYVNCLLELFFVVENVVIVYFFWGLDFCKVKVKRKKNLFEIKLFRILIFILLYIGSVCFVLMVLVFKMIYFFYNVVM